MVRRLCLLAVLFASAAALALPLDLSIASFFRRDADGDVIHDLVSLAEVFAHGLGVACILLTAYVLDVRQRCRMPRVIAAVVGAGLTVDLIKLLVGRFRPRGLEVAQVWDSFCGWFPMFRPEVRQGLSVGQCQSLPSGHAAVATALAIGLALLYPRGRWLFVTFAVLAGLQRIESCAHYPSDTLAGAAVACLVCAAFLSNRGIGRWFDRWDASEANNGCDFSAEAIR